MTPTDGAGAPPTTSVVARADLKVAAVLAAFIEQDLLPGLGIAPAHFWGELARLLLKFAPENRALLEERARLQAAIDAWHRARIGQPIDQAVYQEFLTAIGYLQPEPGDVRVATERVDDEVARIAGPQLVVPALNARFLLNAANARWGSLYDALYGTDALPGAPKTAAYDAERGGHVVERAKAFLDEAFGLADGRHADVDGYRVVDGALTPALKTPGAFVGFRGDPRQPEAILLRRHGLGVELRLDRGHPIGASDRAGVADVVLEAALTTIVDLEDSIAAVDAADKVAAYANWLGVMRGDLEDTFVKNGRSLTRTLNPDRAWRRPDGRDEFLVPGRSLLFVRTVGHLMTTPAVELPDGSQAPEGLLDAMIVSLIALYDLRRLGRFINSAQGSVYIVKPKMHGPKEAAFANRVFNDVEDALGLSRHTLKLGLMDEERRTSANLKACIAEVKDRLAFINTGFLDRTGDEIHTSMEAGAMVRKADIRNADWIRAYEDRNVRIGLACGLAGRGQIGKGMWAAPDRMGDMLEQKLGHPLSGASTAWVPSPTAATLHALHYHAVDVAARQADLARERAPELDRLLVPPLHHGANWSPEAIREEVRNNAQSILGYVVRWIDQGVGCSKVPDIHNVALMEDRATLRISSQHIANWLRHGVVTPEEVDAALLDMALTVDEQNAGDPVYQPMSPRPQASLAFQAARALIFEGRSQPNGYTEPLLHRFRAAVKAAPGSA